MERWRGAAAAGGAKGPQCPLAWRHPRRARAGPRSNPTLAPCPWFFSRASRDLSSASPSPLPWVRSRRPLTSWSPSANLSSGILAPASSLFESFLQRFSFLLDFQRESSGPRLGPGRGSAPAEAQLLLDPSNSYMTKHQLCYWCCTAEIDSRLQSCNLESISQGLVLGCIDADFCK